MSEFSSTKFLTGLRAYAALGVVLIHQGGAGLRGLGTVPNRFVTHLAMGVVVFFVLSAFTLAMSLERSPRSYGRYLVGRMARIAPLYYVVCIAALLVPTFSWAAHFGVEKDFWNLVSHLSFLNLFDVARINGLIGVEWTVVIEVLYYLALPLAVLASRSWKGIGVLIGCTVLWMLTRGWWCSLMTGGNSEHLLLARHWCPQRYAISFLLGVLAYRAFGSQALLGRLRRSWSLVVAIIAFALMIVIDPPLSYGKWVIWYSLLTAWVVLTSGAENRLSRILFENPVALYLGKISYSIYLVHTAIVSWLNPHFGGGALAFPVVLLVVVGVSSLTYTFVERPFIEWSKRLKQRLPARILD